MIDACCYSFWLLDFDYPTRKLRGRSKFGYQRRDCRLNCGLVVRHFDHSLQLAESGTASIFASSHFRAETVLVAHMHASGRRVVFRKSESAENGIERNSIRWFVRPADDVAGRISDVAQVTNID